MRSIVPWRFNVLNDYSMRRIYNLWELVRKHGNELSVGTSFHEAIVIGSKSDGTRIIDDPVNSDLRQKLECVAPHQAVLVYNPKTKSFKIRPEPSERSQSFLLNLAKKEDVVELSPGKEYPLTHLDRLYFGAGLYGPLFFLDAIDPTKTTLGD